VLRQKNRKKSLSKEKYMKEKLNNVLKDKVLATQQAMP